MPRILTVVVSLLFATASSLAQEVEATGVRFSSLRAENGNWLEAAVALNVKPAAGSPGQMVSRVRVALLIGYDSRASGRTERRTEYYRAQAECVALPAGRSDVRFYLPPEVVRRDQVHGDARVWGVELAVGGRSVQAGRGAYAASLASPDQRNSFQTKAAAEAAANDGILLPQYLTPFAGNYPRATPSFVRREPSR